MKLSVAFVTRNRCAELQRALASCFAQRFEDIQYIVVDNASTDSTGEYLRRLSGGNPKVRVCRSAVNLGVAGGRNRAMELAEGEYVFFLDDDAVLATENLFGRVCRYLDGNPKAAALALRTLEKRGGSERFLKGAMGREKGDFIETLQYIGCAHVLRKAAFAEEAPYPPHLTYGGEELYASLRVWDRGYSIVYLSSVLVEHFPSASNRMAERRRHLYILMNLYIVKMLNYPLPFRMLVSAALPVRLLKNRYLTRGSVRLLRDNFRNDRRWGPKSRLRYGTLLMLIGKFGIRHLL